MRALQGNFTILGICMCSTELLPWKNQKRSIRYPITLQKWDSITDSFPGLDLGRGYRGHVPPHTPPIKIYQIELRLKEMICLMIIAETKKNCFSAVQFFH